MHLFFSISSRVGLGIASKRNSVAACNRLWISYLGVFEFNHSQKARIRTLRDMKLLYHCHCPSLRSGNFTSWLWQSGATIENWIQNGSQHTRKARTRTDIWKCMEGLRSLRDVARERGDRVSSRVLNGLHSTEKRQNTTRPTSVLANSSRTIKHFTHVNWLVQRTNYEMFF